MGDYPWGPHGPQSSPHSVTPNPTPAWVPPPPTPDFYTPPAPSFGGGTPLYPGNVPIADTSTPRSGGGYTPRKKGYILALILTFLFGPIGLFYATKKGALTMLFLLVAVPITLGVMGMLPFGSRAHPFAILDHSSVMDPMWSLSVICSMICSVFGVRAFNAAERARVEQFKKS